MEKFIKKLAVIVLILSLAGCVKKERMKDFPTSSDYFKLINILSEEDGISEELIISKLKELGISSPKDVDLSIYSSISVELNWSKYHVFSMKRDYYVSIEIKYDINGKLQKEACHYNRL